jgi:hypothetical protein
VSPKGSTTGTTAPPPPTTQGIREAPRREAYVGVGKEEPVTIGPFGPEVEGVVLAQPSIGQFLDPYHPHNLRPLGGEPGEDLAGAVGRAVVHGDDLEMARVVLSEDGPERRFDGIPLVAGRHDDRDGRVAFERVLAPPCLAQNGHTPHAAEPVNAHREPGG